METEPNQNVAQREEINGAYANRIWWRRIVNVNVTIEIRSLVSDAPKTFNLAVASCRAAFSDNTSLIATFSSLLLLSSYWLNSNTQRRHWLQEALVFDSRSSTLSFNFINSQNNVSELIDSSLACSTVGLVGSFNFLNLSQCALIRLRCDRRWDNV